MEAQLSLDQLKPKSFNLIFFRTKDGSPLKCDESEIDCSITTSETSTVLSLRTASPKMSGSYSCQVQNEAGTSVRTRTLRVDHRPPRISQVSVQGDSTFRLNESAFLLLENSEDAVLHCQADGWPAPSISFSRSGNKN